MTTLTHQITAMLTGIEATEDPMERAKQAGELIKAIQMALPQARLLRSRAVQEMRDAKVSYGDIAKGLGVSRTRIQQYLAGAEVPD